MANVPLSALTATWNNVATAFNGIKLTVTDTASAAASKLISLYVGATLMFSVAKNGHSSFGDQATPDQNTIYGDPAVQLANFRSTITTTSATYVYGANYVIIVNPAANSSVPDYYAQESILRVPSTNTRTFTGRFWALSAFCDISARGATGDVYGSYMAGIRSYGNAPKLYGSFSGAYAYANTIPIVYACYAEASIDGDATDGAATTTLAALFYGGHLTKTAPATITEAHGLWLPEILAGTYNYYFWSDGQGVCRIKEEGSVKGGVYAWYNPAFTKYTAGAVNFERGVLQFNTGSVCEIGYEKGGTGANRLLRLLAPGGLETTATYSRITPTTVAGLVAAATAGAGAKAFVTDALTPTFMATVAAGGAVFTPVYSDGTNWKVG